MNVIKLPSQKQQKLLLHLLHLLHLSFLEIRTLGWQNKAEQAADLADALHNIPIFLNSENFNWTLQKHMIDSYHKKYCYRITNFSKYFDSIFNNQQLDYFELFKQ